jgi:hypothetical protein
MPSTSRVRTISLVVGAIALGLLAGYGMKASLDKKSVKANGGSYSVSCDASDTVYILEDGISSDPKAKGAGNDHWEPVVCAQTGTISWQIADNATNVTGFHVFFDESPCEGDKYIPKLYASSDTAISPCTVNLKTSGAYDYKYELIVDFKDGAGNIQHHYLDPHVIVSGTGTGFE